jgi:hypothetical protein
MLALAVALLAQLQPLPPQLIPLDSDEGARLLFESTARRSYFALSAQFLTQKTQSFCGVASAVMALNALPLEAPIATGMAPFRAFTQDNVFDAAGPALTPAFVDRGGLTVAQLAQLLRANGADATELLASKSSLERFRREASAALAAPAQQVLVDFFRPALGQDMGAHWSPLAAYHAGADRFLVLDVARVRYPPYWVRAADLFAAMDTRDLDAGESRGYLLVAPAAGARGRAEIPSLSHRIWKYGVGAAVLLIALGAALGAAGMRLAMRKGRPS